MTDQVTDQKPEPWDLLVFIGRFQPVHQGHLHVVKQALRHTDNLLVLIGSSNRSRSVKNPFSYLERREVFASALQEELSDRADAVNIEPLPDTLYNDNLWASLVTEKVERCSADHIPAGQTPRIAVVGHSKDESSYYLKSFPGWGFVEIENYRDLSATPLRNSFFQCGKHDALEGSDDQRAKDDLDNSVLPCASRKFLETFQATDAFTALVEEQAYVDHYKTIWRGSPYPPVFVTVDALVRYKNECLFIRRGNSPALGLLAMPGGFLDPGERSFDGAVRELEEETALSLDYSQWVHALKQQRFFDHPARSVRTRTVTQAFYFDITDYVAQRPFVKAQDDAAEVCWVDIKRFETASVQVGLAQSAADPGQSDAQGTGIDPTHFAEDHFFMMAAFLHNWPLINPLY